MAKCKIDLGQPHGRVEFMLAAARPVNQILWIKINIGEVAFLDWFKVEFDWPLIILKVDRDYAQCITK